MYKMYIKILDSLLTRSSFTIEEGEQELRASVFAIPGAFNAFILVYYVSMISTPGCNMREVCHPALLCRNIGCNNYIAQNHRILEQSAVTALLKSTKTTLCTFDPPSSDFAILCTRRLTASKVLQVFFVCKLVLVGSDLE